MIIDTIKDIYNKYPKCSGEIKQEIYTSILKGVLPFCEGDILEIGAFDGRSTKVFAELGKQFGKNVFVIDPWNGRQEGNERVYNEFLKKYQWIKQYQCIEKNVSRPILHRLHI